MICFAKRGGWFEKFAPGSPPRHGAQLRLVNAQQAQLRGVVKMIPCTYRIVCSRFLGSHLHNHRAGNIGGRCRGQSPWLYTWAGWLRGPCPATGHTHNCRRDNIRNLTKTLANKRLASQEQGERWCQFSAAVGGRHLLKLSRTWPGASGTAQGVQCRPSLGNRRCSCSRRACPSAP